MRPGFREHQDRSAALEEAHARPSLPVPIPATLHHLAFSVTGEEAAVALYRLVFAAAPLESERHVIRDEGGLVLKWERHTEFVSLTILAGDDGGRADPLLDHLARSAPREVALLVALRVHVVPASAGVEAVGPIGGRIAGGIGVGTTFQPGADGFASAATVSRQAAGGTVGEHGCCRLRAVGYIGKDDTRWATLEPAGHEEPRDG